MSTDNERFVRVFDRAGADYQRAAGPFVDAVADLVAERAMAADPDSVIDLATGPGTVLAALERRGGRQNSSALILRSDSSKLAASVSPTRNRAPASPTWTSARCK